MHQQHSTDHRTSSTQWLASFLNSLDRFRIALFILLTAILLAAFNGQWQVEPDSALYLTLARNLALGRGYSYHGEIHHLVYPGLPCALVVGFRFFPSHAIFCCDAFIFACSMISLGLVYRLFSLSVNRGTAVMITLLTGLAHESFRYSFEIMPEIPFLASVMAVLAGYEGIYHREETPTWRDWGLLIAGSFAAIHLKPLMVPLIGICVVAMPWKIPRLRRRSAIGAAILLGMLLLFFMYDPRHPFATVSHASYEQLAYREMSRFPARWHDILARNLNDLLGRSIARLVIGVPFGVKLLDVTFSLIIIPAAVTLIRFRLLWGLWILVVIAKLTFLYSHDRYLLPILPLLMFAWWKIIIWTCSKCPALVAKLLFGALLAATMIPSTVKAISTIVDQHRQPFWENYYGGREVALEEIGRKLTEIAGRQDVILAPPGTSTILSFYSDRNVHEPVLAPVLSTRPLLVVPTDIADPAFSQWLKQLNLTPAKTPLFECVRTVRQGGTFAIYRAQQRSVPQ